MMIKITCDRCGAEIKNNYFTIDINSENLYPEPIVDNYYNDCITSTDSVLNSIKTHNVYYLNILKTTNMYCDTCINEIKDFIWRK